MTAIAHNNSYGQRGKDLKANIITSMKDFCTPVVVNADNINISVHEWI